MKKKCKYGVFVPCIGIIWKKDIWYDKEVQTHASYDTGKAATTC